MDEASAQASIYGRLYRQLHPSPIAALLKSTASQEGMIMMAGGEPDPSLFPRSQMTTLIGDWDEHTWKRALKYGGVEGDAGFRAALANVLRTYHEIYVDISEILPTSGAMQALYILSRILGDPGDVVIAEEQTFTGALAAFRDSGLEVVGVPLEEDGMAIDALEKTVHRIRGSGRRIAFLYTIPNHQNPTGVQMSLAKRERLCALSNTLQLSIVEDDAYGLLNFPVTDKGDAQSIISASSQRPIRSFGGAESIIYVGSGSKILAPGLRIGWIVARHECILRAIRCKSSIDAASCTFSETFVGEFLSSPLFARHVLRISQEYQRRQEWIFSTIQAHFPKDVLLKCKPKGGLYMFVQLPREIDGSSVLQRCIEKKVYFAPGHIFAVDSNHASRSCVRLCFADITSKEMAERAITVIASAIEDERQVGGLASNGAVSGSANEASSPSAAVMSPKELLSIIISHPQIMKTFLFFPGTPGLPLYGAALELGLETIQVLNENQLPLVAASLYYEATKAGRERCIPIVSPLAGDVGTGNLQSVALRGGRSLAPMIALLPTTPMPIFSRYHQLVTTFNGSLIADNSPLMMSCNASDSFRRKIAECQGFRSLLTLENASSASSVVSTAVDRAVGGGVSGLIVRPSLFFPKSKVLPGIGASMKQLEGLTGEGRIYHSFCVETLDVAIEAHALFSAERPLLVMGGGCCRKGVLPLVASLQEKLKGRLAIVSTLGAVHLRVHDQSGSIMGNQACSERLGFTGTYRGNDLLSRSSHILWMGSSVTDIHTSFSSDLMRSIKQKSCQQIPKGGDSSVWVKYSVEGSVVEVLSSLLRTIGQFDEDTSRTERWYEAPVEADGAPALVKTVRERVPAVYSLLAEAILQLDESRISHLTLGCGSSVPIMAALLNGARFSISTSSAMGELAGGAFRGRRPVIVAGDGECLLDATGAFGWAIMEGASPTVIFVMRNEVYGLTNRQCPPKLKRRIPSTHDFCALGQGFGINHCMRIDARHDTEMEGGGVKALHREWATTIASALSCEEHCLVEVMLPSGEQEDAFCGSSELFNLYGLRGWTEATSVAGASPVDE